MKINSAVKIRKDNNNWREGKIVGKHSVADSGFVGQHIVQILEPGQVGYEQVIVDSHDVKRLEKLEWVNGECPAADKFLAEQQQLLVDLATEALAKLLPDESVCIEDKTIFAYHRAITLDVEIREKETIGAFIEKPCWVLRVWHWYPATRWEPEDATDAEIGEYWHAGHAVKPLLETIFKLKAADYWDWVSDREMDRKENELDSFL